MRNPIHCTVHAPDGAAVRVQLDGEALARLVPPGEVLARFGLSLCDAPWRLAPMSPAEGESRFLLCPRVIAGARDKRQDRLRNERKMLEELDRNSDYVAVQPTRHLAGSEPDEYLVTFRCKGIIGIDANRRPVYGTHHRVRMVCDEEWPTEPPRLRWETDIWHPNIRHNGTKGVCINKPEWLGGMTLVDLCKMMFEMVQYKNYHAINSPPYPLDGEVAAWVRDFAEPQGIVRRGKPVDDKPFERPSVLRIVELTPQSAPEPKPEPRIKLVGSQEAAPAEPTRPSTPPPLRIRVSGSDG